MVAESATLNGLMPPSEHNSRLCAITYDVMFSSSNFCSLNGIHRLPPCCFGQAKRAFCRKEECSIVSRRWLSSNVMLKWFIIPAGIEQLVFAGPQEITQERCAGNGGS